MRKKLRIKKKKKKIVRQGRLSTKRITTADLLTGIDLKKKVLIKKIYKLDPLYKQLKIDLRRFTLEQLQYHIDKVERKRK